MQLGIITSIEEKCRLGTIRTSDGVAYSFALKSGHTMSMMSKAVVPQLGRQIQPKPFALKSPAVGDPVAFIVDKTNSVTAWAYARHYVEVAERRYGTSFRSEPEHSYPVAS